MTEASKPGKVIPIQAIENSEELVSLYAAHEKIYPRSVSGLFAQWRVALVILTQVVFYGLPWLQWSGRQAVLFDLLERRFFLFGLVLYPQDLIYLSGLLVISAMSLFLFTAVAGRQWCGYACPQTVYTEIFLWIERKVEGDRSARMRLDSAGLSWAKVSKKGIKQFIWITLSLWTGFTFVGYFTPIHVLLKEVMAWGLGPWEIFWVLFYGFATYGNAGYMREQVCKYMCPYARFQSAMFDKDTLIVTYDEARGEPRGARSKKADYQAEGKGACVDCTLCVQVCPTGIDIRNGLQYECISCAACIDVCDSVMDKMGYERGLIRYSTENALKHGWTKQDILRHALRPRVLIYTGILLSVTFALMVSLVLRDPYRFDVVRDRGVMAREVEDGKIENVYRLQVMNASERHQSYHLQVQGLDGLSVDTETHFEVDAAQSRWLPVRVRLQSQEELKPGSRPIEFVLSLTDAPQVQVKEKSVFLIPR